MDVAEVRRGVEQPEAHVEGAVGQREHPAVAGQQLVPAPQPQAPSPVPAPAATVSEGDVVEFSDLDTAPQAMGIIKAEYPRLAMQQRAKASVIVSALVSETGNVVEVKLLKGDSRFGFNEAATRAMRAVRFTPPVKDGKHVRTWRPQTFLFNP